jgi:hypothetical protein
MRVDSRDGYFSLSTPRTGKVAERRKAVVLRDVIFSARVSSDPKKVNFSYVIGSIEENVEAACMDMEVQGTKLVPIHFKARQEIVRRDTGETVSWARRVILTEDLSLAQF